MKKTIYFATTNEGKIKEAQALLPHVVVEPCGLEILEIQSLDPKVVAVQKAKDYYAKLQKPIFVEDVSLSFEALNGLPGTYISDFSKALGNDGLIALLRGTNNRASAATTMIVFVWSETEYEVFEGTVRGTIPQVLEGSEGFGWDPLFIPDGSTKTFAQMSGEEKAEYSMRAIAMKKFASWLEAHPEW